MKRMLSAALAVALVWTTVPVSAQKDQRLSGGSGDGPIARAAALELSRVTLQTEAQGKAGASASGLREVARKIPLGKEVNVRMLSGEKVQGRLRAVRDTGIVIEKPGQSGYSRAKTSEELEGEGAGGALSTSRSPGSASRAGPYASSNAPSSSRCSAS